MRKNTKTVALLAVLSLAAVGCQEEQIMEPQGIVSEVGTMYTIHYTVDGATYTQTLYGEEARQAFLEQLFALAEEGHRVSLRNTNQNGQAISAKEVVVYTTKNKKEAMDWADAMVLAGYDVVVEYNPQTGIYTCTAAR